MATYRCTQCGYLITAENDTDCCICEACGTEFTVAFLSEKAFYIEQLKKKVHDELYHDEVLKRQREEAEANRRAEELQNQTKREEADIKLKEAQARAANAQAANAGKPKTVVINGPNASELGENAIKAFVAKDFQKAFTAADTVLATDKDHLGATFIKVYRDLAVNKSPTGMTAFIAKIADKSFVLTDADLSILEDLIATTPARMCDYEEQILTFVYNNSVGDPSKEESACQFVDSFSPPVIASRTDHLYLTPNMVELYKNLAAYCTIPKTCYALICSINTNPESPIKSGRLYLKSVSTKFFNEYVIPIGGIVAKMKNVQYRQKFSDAYEKYKTTFKQKAQI